MGSVRRGDEGAATSSVRDTASPGAAEAFLLAFHARHPGATARAYARGMTGDGRSTYEVLADAAALGGRVLDLGCGDGFLLERLVARGHAPERLAGVDLSPHEIDAAGRRPTLAAVRLACEDARALSAAPGSFDTVLSHLAFTLMSDLEVVIGEIARLLRPGGLFAAIVGGGPGPGDAFERFLELLAEENAGAAERAPRLGDRRARDAIGLAPLLAAAGFGAVDEVALTVRLGGSGREVWDTLSTAYEAALLPAARLEALRVRFLREVGEQAVPCAMRVRCVSARRR